MESEPLATSVPPADVEAAGGDALAAGDHIDMGTQNDICMNVYDELAAAAWRRATGGGHGHVEHENCCGGPRVCFRRDLVAGRAGLPQDRSSPDA